MKAFTIAAFALISVVTSFILMADEKSTQTHVHDENCGTDGSACALPSKAAKTVGSIQKTEEEWKKELTPNQFHVLRENGTEPPFRNEFWDSKEKGLFICAACQLPLFGSAEKFKSGTGWPSYYAPVDEDVVGETKDKSFGMVRTEVHCKRCGGHLGHIFDDGPKPTGLRYCLNSASLAFVPDEKLEERDLEKYAKHAK